MQSGVFWFSSKLKARSGWRGDTKCNLTCRLLLPPLLLCIIINYPQLLIFVTTSPLSQQLFRFSYTNNYTLWGIIKLPCQPELIPLSINK